MNKYHQEGINFPLEEDGCRKFEKNYVTTDFNVLYGKYAYIYIYIYI